MMRIDRRFLGWGVFLVVLGAVPLAVRGGLLTAGEAGTAWRLWPLFLVGLGIGLLLRGSRAAVVGGLVVAVTAGLNGGGLVANGWGDLGSLACGDARSDAAPAQQSGPLDTAAQVSLEQRCGDLAVHLSEGGAWTLSSTSDPAPEVTATPGELRIRSTAPRVAFIGGLGGPRASWDVGLPRASRIDLETTLDAGSGHLDLRTGQLGSLSVTVNAGDMGIDLEGASASNLSFTLNAGSARIVLPASSLTGSVTVNAGSVKVCAPAGAGLRIATNENITSSFDFGPRGLLRSGSTWTTPGFATATTRIDLSASVNAGSFTLDPAEGCR